MGPTFLYGDSDTPPHLVSFYDHAGDTEVHILDLTPGPSRGIRGHKNYCMLWKVLYVIWNTHVKYDSCISYGSLVLINA